MIARGFKSVIWVAAVGGAAIGCYMVSLQVATERAELSRVESQIIAAKRDIRTLQTELGTRGRLSQLEQWNAEVLALSAPTAAQFLPDQMTLARFDRPEATLDERGAQVRMASAETAAQAPAAVPVVRAVAAPAPAASQPLVRQASFTPGEPKPAAEAKPKAVETKGEAKKQEAKAETVKKAEADKKPDVAKKSEPVKKAEATTAKAPEKASAEKPRTSKIDPKLAADIKAPAKKAQGSGGN